MWLRYFAKMVAPPAVVGACWLLFAYSGVTRFMSPRWDLVAVISFAALVSGLLIVPCAVLVNFVNWFSAKGEEKTLIGYAFLGWGMALAILLRGFAVVPWSQPFE